MSLVSACQQEVKQQGDLFMLGLPAKNILVLMQAVESTVLPLLDTDSGLWPPRAIGRMCTGPPGIESWICSELAKCLASRCALDCR